MRVLCHYLITDARMPAQAADIAGTKPDQIALQNNHPDAAALLQAAVPNPSPVALGAARRHRGRRVQVSG